MNPLLWFYFLLFLLASLFISCQKDKLKPIFLEKYPLILTKIQQNNQKLPSFQSQLSLSFTNQSKTFSADGQAFIDPMHQRIKIILTDTLTQEIVLDLVITQNQIYLKHFQSKKIIKESLSKISFKKIIPQWNLDIQNFLDLIQGKIPLLLNPSSIQKQESPKQIFFKLVQQDKIQLLAVHPKTHQPQKLIFYQNNQKLFQISYKKYFQLTKYLLPKRSDFSYKNSKLILYLSHLQLHPTFKKSLFQPSSP